jgi:hypothetical protein
MKKQETEWSDSQRTEPSTADAHVKLNAGHPPAVGPIAVFLRDRAH